VRHDRGTARRFQREKSRTRPSTDWAMTAAEGPPFSFLQFRCRSIRQTHCGHGRPICSGAPRSQSPKPHRGAPKARGLTASGSTELLSATDRRGKLPQANRSPSVSVPIWYLAAIHVPDKLLKTLVAEEGYQQCHHVGFPRKWHTCSMCPEILTLIHRCDAGANAHWGRMRATLGELK
jgi:hypothetical protein